MTNAYGRGRAVRDLALVGPELGGQRLDADRGQDKRGGQLGHRGEEHQAEPGQQARDEQRERHPEEDGDRPLAERAPHVGQSRRALGPPRS